MPLPKPIFLSYATATGHAAAMALEAALGHDLVYRDESNLEHGKPFPAQLFDALIDARVIVCLLDDAYLASWFCRAELEVALAALQETGDLADSLGRLVFAAPRGSKQGCFQLLPPSVRTIQWPQWDDLTAITVLIRERLDQSAQMTLRERLSPRRLDELRGWIDEEARMPPRQKPAEGQLAANLPAMPGGRCFGRAAELAAIHERLLPVQGPGVCAVVSPGGGGKTRLAKEYLWRFGATHYPGGLVWIDAAITGSEEAQFHGALAQLIPGLPDYPTLKKTGLDIKRRVQEKLTECVALGPVLWVIDNVPEPPAGERPRPLTDWHPELPGQIAVLATSRLWQHPRSINYEIGGLDERSAIALLGQQLPVDLIAADEAQQIVTAVGAWPLALELLNASFAERALSPAEFLEQHGRSGLAHTLDDAMEVLRDQVPEGALRGITETLLLSFERLPGEAQKLACVLGHCAPMEPIPLELIDALGPVAPPKARAALHARSVVTGGDEMSVGQLHPLVASFLAGQDREGTGLAALGDALVRLAESLPPKESASWSAADRLAPHGLAVATSRRASRGDALALGAWLTQLLTAEGRAMGGVILAEQLLARWDDAATATDLGRLRLLTVLGLAQKEAGQLEPARRCLETAVKGWMAIVGDDHPETLEAQMALARALWSLGKLEASQTLDESVLAIRERVLGPDHPDTLRSRARLGGVLFLAGDYTGASTVLEAVLATQERILGPAHSETLATRSTLATVLTFNSDPARAMQLFESLLAVRESVLGPEHPLNLTTRMQQALARLELGDLAGAQTELEAVQASQERILGPDHPSTIFTSYNLGVTLETQGRLRRARDVYEAVVRARERVLGPEHPHTLGARSVLTRTLTCLGDFGAARAHLDAVLECQTRTLGADHPHTLDSRTRLAALHLAVGDLAAALTMTEDLLAVETLLFGAEHPYTLQAGRLLLRILRMGDDVENVTQRVQDGLKGARNAEDEFAKRKDVIAGIERDSLEK
ncbi:MAG: tetratricopeptide repeat protein, partial [bacterium]